MVDEIQISLNRRIYIMMMRAMMVTSRLGRKTELWFQLVPRATELLSGKNATLLRKLLAMENNGPPPSGVVNPDCTSKVIMILDKFTTQK